MKIRLRRRRVPHLLLFLALPGFVLRAAPSPQTAGPVEHSPVLSFDFSAPVTILVRVPGGAEWVTAFVRPAGAEEFTAVPMTTGPDRAFEARLDPAAYPSGFEYYLALKSAGRIGYLPPGVPSDVFKAAPAPGAKPPEPSTAPPVPSAPQPSESPTPPAATRKTEIHAGLDGFVDGVLAGKTEGALDRSAVRTDETARLDVAVRGASSELTAQMRATYSTAPLAGQDRFDLPGFLVTATMGHGKAQAGDIVISESEFSVSGLGRRGLDLAFDDQRLYARVFAVNTEQPFGFKGFGVPRSAAGAYGGAAGASLFRSAVSLKAVYLTGRDDPALGANLGFGALLKPREGWTLALVEDTRLFSGRLNLGGEYALSRVDRDLTTPGGARDGRAWRVRASYAGPVVDAAAGYRNIDPDFDTVAQPFFVNGRETYEAGAGVTVKTVRIAGRYSGEEADLGDESLAFLARDRAGSVELSWQFAPGGALRVDWTTRRQSAVRNAINLLEGELRRRGVSAGVQWTASPGLMLNLSAVQDTIYAREAPGRPGRSFGLNLSGFVRGGERLSLTPAFGWTRTRNPLTGGETTALTAFGSATWYVVAGRLYLSASGGASRMDLETGGRFTSVNLESGLNYDIRNLAGMGRAVLSLLGSAVTSRFPGGNRTDARLLARVDFSLF